MLEYKALLLGELRTNCYLLWDKESKECLVIDPADDGVAISEEIEILKLKLKGILLTHGHFDHSLGVIDLKLIYKAAIYMNSEDTFLIKRQKESAEYFLKRKVMVPNIIKIDKDLSKIKSIKVGKESLKVIKSPGHSPGSVSFYNKENKLLFSGDTLFLGCRGMGYVEFEQLEDAVQAKEKLHGYPIGDLKIIVDFAEPDPFMTPEGKARHQEAVARKPKRFNKDNFLPHPDNDSDDYQKAKKSSFRRTNSQEPSSETTRLRFKPKKKARQSIFDSRNFGSHIGAKFASRNKKKKRR